MFAQFSSGYHLGRRDVEPRAGARAAMRREQREHVSEQLDTAEGAAGEDASEGGGPTPEQPRVMRIGGTHVPVHGAEGVPERTVALPEDWLDATRLRNLPTLTEVLLAKRERAEQLLNMEEETPTMGV